MTLNTIIWAKPITLSDSFEDLVCNYPAVLTASKGRLFLKQAFLFKGRQTRSVKLFSSVQEEARY